MTAPRGGFTVSPLGRGQFLIAGGSDGRRVLASAKIFDAASMRFRRTGGMGSPRDAHATAPLERGRVLITGGRDARTSCSRRPRSTTRAERRFKLTDAVVRLPSGRVLVAGGGARVEVYEPATRRFRAAGRVGASLASATATVLRDGRVLVAGGYDDSIRVSREAWVFTP
jgi:hypothetical protein